MIGLFVSAAIPWASAGDFEAWYGGAASAVGGYTLGPVGSGGAGAPSAIIQAEGDLRLAWKSIYFRVDTDVHLDPMTDGLVVEPFPPEEAFVQFGRETWHVALGITNAPFGLEEWDEWLNYTVTPSVGFNGASPGRLLGAMPGLYLDDGTEIFVYGGSDIDFAWPAFTPTFGAGIATEQDAFSTWSGVAAYPLDDYYLAIVAGELYPVDALTVAADLEAGISAGAPFFTGALVLSALPEAPVHPFLRGEYIVDPGDAALGGAAEGIPDATAALGAKVDLLGFMQLGVQAGMSFDSGAMQPQVMGQLSIFRPDDEAPSSAIGPE